MKWPANKWCLFWSGGWVLTPNETPDENTPCSDIKTHVCLYQNYNNKSKNLNIALYCHQLTTILNECLLPYMINHCLQLAFTFTLQFTRFTFTEQFVNIAKHCGQFFLDCTWDLLGKIQLFFKSSHSVKAIFEFMRFPAW